MISMPNAESEPCATVGRESTIATKYHSAPSRMRKRDTNVLEELTALMSTHGKEHAATLSGLPAALPNSNGSWSRQRKQRTGEEGRLSLWEVSAALNTAAAELSTPADESRDKLAGLEADLEALVAAELSEASDIESEFDALADFDAPATMEVSGIDLGLEETLPFADAVFGKDMPPLAYGDTDLDLLDLFEPEGPYFSFDASPTSVTQVFPLADSLPVTESSPQGGQATQSPLTGSTGRNGTERKEWTAAEDEIICSNVLLLGCKWRKIAALLPGRSDDAVRNRWSRVRPSASPPSVDGMVVAKRTPSDGVSKPERVPSDGVSKPERVSWTKAEDLTILSGVVELGHRWNQLSHRLPGRTEHAIRNRFHRLQTLLGDGQCDTQRVLAPSEPLSLGFEQPLAFVAVA